jgi:hypothetical protein
MRNGIGTHPVVGMLSMPFPKVNALGEKKAW